MLKNIDIKCISIKSYIPSITIYSYWQEWVGIFLNDLQGMIQLKHGDVFTITSTRDNCTDIACVINSTAISLPESELHNGDFLMF